MGLAGFASLVQGFMILEGLRSPCRSIRNGQRVPYPIFPENGNILCTRDDVRLVSEKLSVLYQI